MRDTLVLAYYYQNNNNGNKFIIMKNESSLFPPFNLFNVITNEIKCSFELSLQVLYSYVSYILFSCNAHRLSVVGWSPATSHSGASAVLGLFCLHAAYCTFYMFESLDGLWVGDGGRELGQL